MSEVEVRYRYRLRVSAAQAQLIQAVFDTCRFVWNQALGRWGELWRHEGIPLRYGDAAAELTDWRGRWEWLAAEPQCPQQQTLRRLYGAISAFFDKANPAKHPRFKKKSAGYASAEWTRNGFKVSGSGLGTRADDRLEVATAAGRMPLRVVWSRPLPSLPSSVTVYRDRAGRWWASFVTRVETPHRPESPTGRCTGLDLGLETFATTEDPATDISNPRFARQAAKALARSQRNTARKQPRSKGRASARRRAARVAARVTDQRADFHHKTARRLVTAYDRIGVEDLKIKNMSRRGKGRRKARLNRAIADAGWGQFLRVLRWQAQKAAKEVVTSPVRDSTQRCSTCGAKAKPRIELSDRVFRCPNVRCGLVLDRDRNAARNLNPSRPGVPSGGAEPPGTAIPAGNDGGKTTVPAGSEAA